MIYITYIIHFYMLYLKCYIYNICIIYRSISDTSYMSDIKKVSEKTRLKRSYILYSSCYRKTCVHPKKSQRRKY